MNPAQEPESGRSLRHWVFVIAMNVAVLVELCVAMYLATGSPDDFEATFMKAFFGMLIPTLALGVIGKRRLCPAPVRVGG
jgi:hypothetical protein